PGRRCRWSRRRRQPAVPDGVGKGAELEQPDVQVHSPDREHAHPGPAIMTDVEHRHALPEPVAGAVAAEAVETATRHVTERVAAKCVAGQAYHVDEQQGGAQAEMKRTVRGKGGDG